MAFKLPNRVHETSTTGGTGPYALLGPLSGKKSVGSRLAVADTTFMTLSQSSSNKWVTALVTYSATNEITVTTIFESSEAADAAPSFTGGQPIEAFVDLPAFSALTAAAKAILASSMGVPSFAAAQSLTDAEQDQARRNISAPGRVNFLLGTIYQSRALAEYRRFVSLFSTGFRGASDALNGINTGSSSNYAVTPASGYVSPTSTSTVNGNFAQANSNAITFANSGSSIFHGFRWVATASGTISTVVVNVSTFTTGGNVTAKLYSASGSNPGTQIGSSSSVSLLAGAGNAVFTFLTPPAVVSGTTYWIVLDGSAGGSLSVTLTTAATIAGYDSGRASTATGVSPDNYAFTQTIRMQINFTTVVNNMTVVSTSQTSDASASIARALIEYDPQVSVTLNTDLSVEVTCNGGTNWTAGTLALVTDYSGNSTQRKVAEIAEVNCTAGSSFAARVKTLTNKDVRVYGLALSVR